MNFDDLQPGELIGKRPNQELFSCALSPELQTLRDRTSRDLPLTLSERVTLVSELSLILSFLHEQGVVHRDLQPENIYLDQEHTLYLGNFTAAKRLGTFGGELIAGTPGYAPPEQLQGSIEHLEPRSDLFSLGVLLYELLAGFSPFAGATRTAALLATLEKEPPSLAQLVPGCPEELSVLCEELLAKDISARPSSAHEVRERLRVILHSPSTVPPGANTGEVIATSPSKEEAIQRGLSIGATLPTIQRDVYEFSDELGRGGLGKVLHARDHRLNRAVAVKELLKDAGPSRARFLREVFITAKLQHPSIVPIYEAGVWPSGEPFYAMKLVSGKPFDRMLDRADLQERLSLLPHLINVVDAIAYAHEKKIIHRDLKPHNILVGDFGETVVIDWGLAKDLNTTEEPPETHTAEIAPEDSPRSLTGTGEVMGTPAYMPPEQALGRSVDERADIYSIGAILYSILAGQPAYAGKSGAVIKALLNGPPLPLDEIAPRAPRELRAIAEKAMAREPEQRYMNASALADDLKSFQAGRWVSAHQYSLGDKLLHIIRRHHRVFITAGVFALLLIALGVYSYVINVRARRDAERASELAQNAEKKQRAISLDQTLRLARASLAENPTEALQYLKSIATSYPEYHDWRRLRTISEDALSLGTPQRLGGAGWADPPGHRGVVGVLTFSPDGEHLASGGFDRTVRIWNTTTGRDQLIGEHGDIIWRIAYSPNGEVLASTAPMDYKIHLWSANTGAPLRDLSGHTHNVYVTLFSPNGEYLASSSYDQTVRIWSVATGAELQVLRGHTDEVFPISWSPDSKYLASGANDRTVRVWNIETGESRVLTGYSDRINSVEFSPAGDFLATQSNASEIILWDTTTWEQRRSMSGQKAKLSPDGALLASTDPKALERTVTIWSTATGNIVRTLTGMKGSVNLLTFSPDGKTLAAANNDHSIYLWDLSQGAMWRLRTHTRAVMKLAFSPDSQRLASAGEDPGILLWDLAPLRGQTLYEPATLAPMRIGQEPTEQQKNTAVVVSPDADLIALAFADGAVRLRKLSTKEELLLDANFPLGAIDVDAAFSFSSDSRWLAAIGEKKIRVWDLLTHTSRDIQTEAEPCVLAFARSGDLLASGSKDNQVRLFHASSGALVKSFAGHKDHVIALDFSPDGETIASSSQDYTIRVWNITTGEHQILNQEKNRYWSIRFSPDGKLLAGLGYLASVRLWDVSTHAEQELSGANGVLYDVQFSPDSKRVIGAGDSDGGLILWDLATLESQRVGRDQQFMRVWALQNKEIIGLDADFKVRRFVSSLPETEAGMLGWLKALPMPSAEVLP